MSEVTSAPRRPRLLWPALLSILGVAILCTLGSWQIARMNEKRVFIDRLAAQAAGAPAAMPATASWASLDPAALDLTRVSAQGTFIDGPFAGVRTTIAAGERGTRQLAGFGRWIFQGFRLDDGGVILVNRGFVPEGRLGEIKPASGPATVTGFLRAAGSPRLLHAGGPARQSRVLHPRPGRDRRLARHRGSRAVLSRGRAPGRRADAPGRRRRQGADRAHSRQPPLLCADLVRAGADADRGVCGVCLAGAQESRRGGLRSFGLP
ncbi:MAG: hypothetical protein C0447_07175 [Methylobacterium sp.]|nr:hypothetical protein [Methylobacterium sp.]